MHTLVAYMVNGRHACVECTRTLVDSGELFVICPRGTADDVDMNGLPMHMEDTDGTYVEALFRTHSPYVAEPQCDYCGADLPLPLDPQESTNV